MSWLNETGDRVAILQMNSELRNAQLEMLSAQCATDRLRLHYSVESIARHAQPDTLRKAWSAANALYEYYNSIARLVPGPGDMGKSSIPSVNEAKLNEAIARVADYLRAQREHFRPSGLSLADQQRQAMRPYFSLPLLDQVRIVALDRQQIPNPPFYIQAKAMGIKDLPDLTHMTSLTFEDVLVFHGEMDSRALFHSLVHAVQFEVLGLERYAELFVRGFLRTGSHINVPLEAHVFLLESEFAGSPSRVFSVEERVRLWTNQGRY